MDEKDGEERGLKRERGNKGGSEGRRERGRRKSSNFLRLLICESYS